MKNEIDPTPSHGDEIAAHLEAADAARHAGDLERATRHVDAATALIGQHDELHFSVAVGLAGAAVAYDQGRHDDALTLACAAHGEALKGGNELLAGLAAVHVAAVCDAAGRHHDARSWLQRARTPLEKVGSAENLAFLDETTGVVLFQLGESGEAIDALTRAIAAFESLGDEPGAARVSGNLGVCLQAVGQLDEAERRFSAAERAATRAGHMLEAARWQVNRALIAATRGESARARDLLDEAITRFESAGQSLEVAHCLVNRAILSDPPNRDDLERARATYITHSQPARVAIVEHALHVGPAPDVSWLRATIATLERHDRPIVAAALRYELARALRTQGDNAAALDAVLSSLVVIDRARYRLHHSPLRATWSHLFSDIYATAFELAASTNDPDLLTELIETARAQLVPDTSRPPDERSLDLMLAAAADMSPGETERSATASELALAAVGAVPAAGAVPAISVGGTSRLLSYAVESLPTVDLDTIRTTLGGPDAWWWSTWTFGRSLYWSLRSPDQTWTGALTLPDTLLAQATLAAATRDDDILRDAAHELGRYLVPPPLIEETDRRARHRDATLTIALAPAPELATVPWALLTAGTGPLLERAEVFVAPPVALCDALDSRPAPPLVADPVILDPTNDLLHARRVPPRVRRLLAGVTVSDADPRAALATRDRVLDVLAATEPGASSLMLYSGHVIAARAGAPAEAALALADGHLSAHDLLLAEGIGAPCEVVLAACASADLSTAGTGEWLGLAPALLVRGASTVIATAWPIADTNHTAVMTDLVVRQRTRSHHRPSLRTLQLRSSRLGVPATVWASFVEVRGRTHVPAP